MSHLKVVIVVIVVVVGLWRAYWDWLAQEWYTHLYMKRHNEPHCHPLLFCKFLRSSFKTVCMSQTSILERVPNVLELCRCVGGMRQSVLCCADPCLVQSFSPFRSGSWRQASSLTTTLYHHETYHHQGYLEVIRTANRYTAICLKISMKTGWERLGSLEGTSFPCSRVHRSETKQLFLPFIVDGSLSSRR